MGRIEGEDFRRRQLIEATIDTLAEAGFNATTLALIGQRAQVSPGLIAHYFDDKDGLLEATLRNLAGAARARRRRRGSARRGARASASRRSSTQRSRPRNSSRAPAASGSPSGGR